MESRGLAVNVELLVRAASLSVRRCVESGFLVVGRLETRRGVTSPEDEHLALGACGADELDGEQVYDRKTTLEYSSALFRRGSTGVSGPTPRTPAGGRSS